MSIFQKLRRAVMGECPMPRQPMVPNRAEERDAERFLDQIIDWNQPNASRGERAEVHRRVRHACEQLRRYGHVG